MKRLLIATLMATVTVLAAGPHAFAQDLPVATIGISPARPSIGLGEQIDLIVTVTNTSDVEIPDLSAHIDVTDLASGGSVDPEDWSQDLTRPVGRLAPGDTTEILWQVQPIAPGTFTLYAVLLTPNGADVIGSNVSAITVANQRSLNPNGVLPVVIIMPLAVAGLLGWRIRRQHS